MITLPIRLVRSRTPAASVFPLYIASFAGRCFAVHTYHNADTTDKRISSFVFFVNGWSAFYFSLCHYDSKVIVFFQNINR